MFQRAHGLSDGFFYLDFSDLLLDGDGSELAHGQALKDGVSEIVDVGLSGETTSSHWVSGQQVPAMNLPRTLSRWAFDAPLKL